MSTKTGILDLNWANISLKIAVVHLYLQFLAKAVNAKIKNSAGINSIYFNAQLIALLCVT